MKKTKPKTKTVAKKAAKKRAGKKEKHMDLAAVRKDLATMVVTDAQRMAKAVVDEALKGELAPMKYLFEMVGLHPLPGDEGEMVPQEDSLVRVLLKRLGLPEDPMIAEPGSKVAAPVATKDSADEADEELAKAASASAVGSGEDAGEGSDAVE